jgi:Glycosyltransferase family 87
MSRGRLFLICILAILSVAYLAKGLYFGIFVSGGRFAGAVDLHSRWVETRYVLRGENPYSIRKEDVELSLGSPSEIDYPPWTYISALPLLWPSWPAVRIWYAACNLASLLFIVCLLLKLDHDKKLFEDRLLLALSVTAIAAICTTMGNGNFGVIVLALLFGAWITNEAGYQIAAGLLLGLAMLKPNMAAPFMLIPLVQRKFRPLFVAAVYLVFASIVAWALTRTNPLEMLLQMLRSAKRFTDVDQGPLGAVRWLGLPYEYAVPVTAISCVGLLSVPMWLRRNGETMTLFAFAGVMARLWTYNSNYSNMLLAFLLVALSSLAIGEKRFEFPAFLAVGASLWIPASLTNAPVAEVSEVAIWMSGLLYLFVLTRRPATVFAENRPEPAKLSGEK